jgi:hypothetical protein
MLHATPNPSFLLLNNATPTEIYPAKTTIAASAESQANIIFESRRQNLIFCYHPGFLADSEGMKLTQERKPSANAVYISIVFKTAIT